MNKMEFLSLLDAAMSKLPEEERRERLAFYEEMINDGMEEGLCEEDAVKKVGSFDEILSSILPQMQNGEREEKTKTRRLRVWEIVLLCLGSPIWLSLLIAAFAIVISLYAVLWSLIAVAWAVFASFIGGAVGGIASAVVFFCTSTPVAAFAMLGAGICLAGLAIFAFFGCICATKGGAKLSALTFLGIQCLFTGKRGSKK